MRFQSDCRISKKAFLVTPFPLPSPPPDSHNLVVEQPVVEPKEKTPDELRVSRKVQETKHKQGNWLVQCFDNSS